MDADGVLKIAPASWGKGCSIPPRLIIEKIQPRRIVLEETEELMNIEYLSQNIVLSNDMDNVAQIAIKSRKVWREVKETDLSLNSDDAKLSLSVAECNCLATNNNLLANKLKKFIKENS